MSAREKKWFRNVWAGVTPIEYVTIRLTSAEILLIYTTPKKLVDAPGAGKIIEFVSAAFFLDHGGTDYAGGGNLVIQHTSADTAVRGVTAASDLINASADAYNVMTALSTDVVAAVNDGLELTNASGVHTTGDGLLTVHVAYRIHDFN